MKYIYSLLLLAAFSAIVMFGHGQPAFASSKETASKYVEKLGDTALATISNKSFSKDQKQAKLDALFSDNVDFNWVGRFVMGRYWRQATDAQKARYLKEYKKFLIVHYTSRFTDYTSGSFKITSAQEDGDGEYTVGMQITSNDKGAEPVLVDYRVRAEGNGFKIFDVIVEGVSLITTQRSEFASVLNDKGIDHLIEQLAAKSKPGAKPTALKGGDGKAASN
jgi:phospholipid transport system substrate-binding protein